ncbi:MULTISPECIES: hypothetical protein [unclassified Kitasatospora]|uniref:hypothetical protein n=1 Tax=unclassified Kitasatospora TaxID=2633591 RepID=UPI00070FB243|nr:MULTISPECIES: hypothetical protein [unclassified Kitasatospora]KQV04758.1 hypothetical protein ASC99_15435 [Kitasatospora sp. Root107]KRB60717.1 hypothetical protein ASE03_10075 [Kitasatospora sp. Root187]
MARKPPARVRAGLAREPRAGDYHPRRVVPGLSGTAQRAVAAFELARDRPGGIAAALEEWERFVRRSPQHEPFEHSEQAFHMICEDDDLGMSRALLEQALRALPSRSARELRSVVGEVDRIYLARVRPDPRCNGREDWWRFL